MMSMFDEGANELVFPILKSNATHADLFRSYRNQTYESHGLFYFISVGCLS
jgi:hypothetical protein